MEQTRPTNTASASVGKKKEKRQKRKRRGRGDSEKGIKEGVRVQHGPSEEKWMMDGKTMVTTSV